MKATEAKLVALTKAPLADLEFLNVEVRPLCCLSLRPRTNEHTPTPIPTHPTTHTHTYTHTHPRGTVSSS